MNAEEFLKAGNTAGSLASLAEQVRAKPGDSKARVFLAQLLCVLGQWERALNQLNIAAELDALAVPMKQVYGEAIRCEGLRADVFAGRRTPMVFGQPDEWLALLIESLLQSGQGQDPAAARTLRQRAFDSAPATSGQLDGQAFEWIADADMRLGPVLEAYVNGRYYWVPFARLSKVTIEPPEDLRDCVWTPANLIFSNGGEALALIPTRYPGSERATEGALQLARRTEWSEPEPGQWTGLGQRMLSTDAGERALMDVREIALGVSGMPAGGPPGEIRDA